jgi:hypothetical protein
MNNKKIQKNTNTSKKEIPVKMLWNDTPNFSGGSYSMISNIREICGETVFGKKRGQETFANGHVINFLIMSSKAAIFKCVEGGKIINKPLSSDDLVTKLVEQGNRAFIYYTSLNEHIEVRDHWSEDALVRKGTPLNISIPLHIRVLKRDGKRFSGNYITAKEQVVNMIKNSRDMLAEGHVIYFLNSGLKCPECKEIGHIGWCDSISHLSVDAFRDAVCMNCHSKGVYTLFEIKTRWENSVKGKWTYAGSFAALNTLMTISANIYLVIASRDTGNVRIGRITSARMRGNHNWLYALQEGLSWGSPSSFVTCAKGLFLCPVKMTPLIETMPDHIVDDITSTALTRLKTIITP